ncbi:Methyltransferase type 11 protein [Rutstroemia sp. NJR-2017a BVV2]|nr:Methyltransferase type 11 protein [Rutstroemia sp. NJR-2017a BVV2]
MQKLISVDMTENIISTSSTAAESLFDEINISYEDAYGKNLVLEKQVQDAISMLGEKAIVLDVGCGTGFPVSSTLAKVGYDVTGIDISQKMVDLCQKRAKGTFIKADMTSFQPQNQFDAIFAFFPLFQLSYRSTHSMIFKFASWLKPGGLLLIGTIPAEALVTDESLYDSSKEYVEGCEAPFMGNLVKSTLLTTQGWHHLFQQAGFEIVTTIYHPFQPNYASADLEPQMFLTGRRYQQPLLGPYPLPAVRRPPSQLSEKAWEPFAKRLTRHEFDAVLEITKLNKEVLDVGSGHGELPIAVAKKVGKVYALEPNTGRNDLIVSHGDSANVHVAKGTAEAMPYGDRKFDAVVAMWILHYVDDLEKSLTEMVRVVDPAAPNARIVIVQGAPDNDVINLINETCGPIVARDTDAPTIDHQGFLLAKACDVFTAHGFGDISLERVNAYCNFPEEDIPIRVSCAASILANLWYRSHPRLEEMKKAFIPVLEKFFADKPFQVGDDGVILVAKPTVKQ